MKVRELIEMLSSLPLDHRTMDIFIDTGGEEYYDMSLCVLKEDETPVGYVFERAISYDKPEIVFDKDVH